jgi:hypothetical protein
MMRIISLEQELLKDDVDREYLRSLKVCYIEKHTRNGILDLDAYNTDYTSHLEELKKIYQKEKKI